MRDALVEMLTMKRPLAKGSYLVVVCAAMAGMPLMDVDRATVRMVVTQTPFGAAWQLRLVALEVAFVACVAMYRRGNRDSRTGRLARNTGPAAVRRLTNGTSRRANA